MMKRKKLYKILIAFLLSISLSLYAPVSHLKQEPQAAVTEVVVLSAATLLIMYMASVGVSYIFDGMTSDEAQAYIREQWNTYVNQNNISPNITPNNDWKWGKLGRIVLSAGLATLFGSFTGWLLNEHSLSDNEVETIESASGGVVTNPPTLIGYVDVNQDDVTVADLDLSVMETADEWLARYGGVHSYQAFSNYYSLLGVNENTGSANNKKFSIRFKPNQGSSDGVLSASLGEQGYYYTRYSKFAYYLTKDGYIIGAGLECAGDHVGEYVITKMKKTYRFINVEVSESESSIAIKTGVVDIPAIPGENEDEFVYGLGISNPFATIEQDEDGVPIPQSEKAIWEKIWERVQENSAAATAYNPTYEVINNYGDVVTINNTTYDTPLTSEEEDIVANVSQPAWAVFRSDDVPGFVNDIITYFRENNIWSDLKHKFPFSLPYDAYLIGTAFFDTSYDVMDELPTAGSTRRLVKSSSAPIYQINVPTWDNGSYILTLDFSLLDPWRPLFRAAAGILFTVLLITGV